VARPTFRTRAGGLALRERSINKRGVASSGLLATLFADDCEIFYEARVGMVTGIPYLFNHLRKFGLRIHV
jgi:hypothetical protein